VSLQKNLAFAEVDVTAYQGELLGVSGKTARRGFVAPEQIRLFRTHEVGSFFRGYDAETLILENIGKQLSPDSFGTIRLFSERPVCGSCEGVAAQFRQAFPKIKLVISSGPKLP
jgi:hypothetical protein